MMWNVNRFMSFKTNSFCVNNLEYCSSNRCTIICKLYFWIPNYGLPHHLYKKSFQALYIAAIFWIPLSPPFVTKKWTGNLFQTLLYLWRIKYNLYWKMGFLKQDDYIEYRDKPRILGQSLILTKRAIFATHKHTHTHTHTHTHKHLKFHHALFKLFLKGFTTKQLFINISWEGTVPESWIQFLYKLCPVICNSETNKIC